MSINYRVTFFVLFIYLNADNNKVLHNNNNNNKRRRKLPNSKLTASKACFLLAKMKR
jgi:hypothetical protein